MRIIPILIIVQFFVSNAAAQTTTDGFRTDVNALVTQVKASFDKLYVAGPTISTVNGTARSRIARLNQDGSLDTAYNPNPNAGVQAIGFSGAKLVVVGSFSNIGGGASGGIARLNYDGTNDGTFTAAVSGAATIAEQADGKILIGGSFVTVGGQTRTRLARFNTDGTLDSGFAPVIDNSVFGITIQKDGKILIAGQFQNVNGQARWSFARLNIDGSNDANFNVNPAYPGAGGTAYTSAVQADGKIIVGGNFTLYGGSTIVRNRIVRLKANGDVDTTFSPDLDAAVLKVVVQPNDKIILCGSFTTLNGVSRTYTARLNRNGTPDTGFAGSTNAQVYDATLYQDGRIFIGGDFTSVNGFPSYNRAARLYPDGRLETDMVTTFAGSPPAEMLALPNGMTLIAGGFTSVGGAARQGLARVGWTGANDTSFANPQITGGWASALAVQPDGRYLVGGDFTAAGGTSQGKLARFSTSGVIDGSFAPVISFGTSSAYVDSIAVQPDSKILVSGQFTTVNGTSRTRIARLNATGALDTTFVPPNIDFSVNVMALQSDGKVLIGGGFETINGQSRPGLARLNADGTLDTGFNPTLNGIVREVYDIKFDRAGKILIGGSFTGVSGNGRANLARLNSDGSNDTTFTADPIDGTVLVIQQDTNDYIFILGRFDNVGSFAHKGIAMLNPTGSVNSLFQDLAPNNIPLTMLIREDGRILIGGYFTTIGGQARAQFAAISRNTSPPIYILTANSATVSWYRDGVAPEVYRVVFEHSTDGINYTTLGNGTASAFPYYTWNLAMPAGTPSGYIRARGYFGDFSDRRSVVESEIYYFNPLTPLPGRPMFDFDGDGKTDPSVYRPSNGVWYLSRSAQGFAAYQFGLSSDILTPEDFDGDNKTDLAVFRPSNGVWYVLRSSDFTFYGAGFGTTGDIPAPGDYDGDGRADTVVYRPSQGIWYLQRSTAGFSAIAFGVAEDKPAIGDFDGDGKADISVYRPSSGNWFRMNSSNNSFTAVQFGAAGDKIVPADYTGDGKTDIAVWRPSNGTWYIFRSEDQNVYGVSFGVNGDIPSPGDYDGDGRADQAVWRSGAQGYFYLNRSTAGFGAVPWGLADDKPIANAFVF
ncbi:MAG: VCBS repeat-containing protein [Pyrinomonadaceae bacterium]|nr:VCBS repeat-containing protein [Pyrinomonadaceae bacterium]